MIFFMIYLISVAICFETKIRKKTEILRMSTNSFSWPYFVYNFNFSPCYFLVFAVRWFIKIINLIKENKIIRTLIDRSLMGSPKNSEKERIKQKIKSVHNVIQD